MDVCSLGMPEIESARMVNKCEDGRGGDDGIVYRSRNHKCRYIRRVHRRARSRHEWFEASSSGGQTQYRGPTPQDTSAVSLIHSLGMHENATRHSRRRDSRRLSCLSAPAARLCANLLSIARPAVGLKTASAYVYGATSVIIGPRLKSSMQSHQSDWPAEGCQAERV